MFCKHSLCWWNVIMGHSMSKHNINAHKLVPTHSFQGLRMRTLLTSELEMMLLGVLRPIWTEPAQRYIHAWNPPHPHLSHLMIKRMINKAVSDQVLFSEVKEALQTCLVKCSLVTANTNISNKELEWLDRPKQKKWSNPSMTVFAPHSAANSTNKAIAERAKKKNIAEKHKQCWTSCIQTKKQTPFFVFFMFLKKKLLRC